MNFPHFISIMNQLCPNAQCLSRLKSKRFSNRGLSHHYNTFPMCLKAAQICVAVTANAAPTFLSPPTNPCSRERDINWNYNYNPWEDATDQTDAMLCQISEKTQNITTQLPPTAIPVATTSSATASHKHTILLMQLLDSINCPDYAFKKIMKWAYHASIEGFNLSHLLGLAVSPISSGCTTC